MPTNENNNTTAKSATPEKIAPEFMITRYPGGIKEHRVKLSALEICDLWHVAGASATREKILDVWHLAHDLKRELGTAFELIVALQGALFDRTRQREEAIDALRACLDSMDRQYPHGLPVQIGTECEENDWRQACRLARATIAKAEGRAQ